MPAVNGKNFTNQLQVSSQDIFLELICYLLEFKAWLYFRTDIRTPFRPVAQSPLIINRRCRDPVVRVSASLSTTSIITTVERLTLFAGIERIITNPQKQFKTTEWN